MRDDLKARSVQQSLEFAEGEDVGVATFQWLDKIDIGIGHPVKQVQRAMPVLQVGRGQQQVAGGFKNAVDFGEDGKWRLQEMLDDFET